MIEKAEIQDVWKPLIQDTFLADLIDQPLANNRTLENSFIKHIVIFILRMVYFWKADKNVSQTVNDARH